MPLAWIARLLAVWPRALATLLAIVATAGCIPADSEDIDRLVFVDAGLAAGDSLLEPPVDTRPAPKDDGDGERKPVLLGFACDSPTKGPYHPPGYADSDVHGTDAKLQREDCRTCHGANLEGCNFAGGCDNCHDGGHPAGWRENCTYCHGGLSNTTGAPPSDLLRDKLPSEASFLAHDAHVVGTLHAPYDCTQCHAKPEDVMSAGHVFDDTKGAAEVTFAAGLSKDGVYEGAGTCSNLYCHGNRRENGTIEHQASATDCNACHAYDDETKLSGRHDAHVNGGLLGFLFDKVACTECHADVIDGDGAIKNPALHVNGQVDLTLEAGGITYDGTRCSGTCHGAPHTFISTWQP